MTIERGRFRWMVPLVALLLFAAAAAVSYNMGVAQGIAQTAATSGAATAYPYAWHGPFGYGPFWHGPGFLMPLFFILFWLFVIRAVFWGGPWRRACHGPGPWGYHDGRDGFEDWHRRAHERMKEAPPADDPGRGR